MKLKMAPKCSRNHRESQKQRNKETKQGAVEERPLKGGDADVANFLSDREDPAEFG